MPLIKSISGIRGTIGGKPGDNLTPEDAVIFTAAYARWLIEVSQEKNLRVIVGRDARISGEIISDIVISTINAMGIDVIDLGLSTTPTVELAVIDEKADGGIIVTASHNPYEWNALKLLNDKGEFISASDGRRIIDLAEAGNFTYSEIDHLGKRSLLENYIDHHIDRILAIKTVDVSAIGKRNWRIVIDAVNSTGGIALPRLLKKLGVKEVIELNCDANGIFPHNPEPLEENLKEVCDKVTASGADLGIAVDPDVDRLVFIQENGKLFGEEYSLVAVADYILSRDPGDAVTNLSSSRALRDITSKFGGNTHAAAVGEVYVVQKMKEVNAKIGGEGNGGIIYPDLHYGRDALVGIALFLSHLSLWKNGESKISELRSSYPDYAMSKNKIELPGGTDLQFVLNSISSKYKDAEQDLSDGLKIDFENEWVHLRRSNTEPIIRIYTESGNKKRADQLAEEVMNAIHSLI